jgi:prefoldin subunit 5
LLAIAPAGPIIGSAFPLVFPAFIVGAPALLGGGYYAWRYYRGVVNDTKSDLHKRIDELQKSYHASLDELTQKERSRLTQYGQQVLIPIYSRLEVLAQRYAAQLAALRAHINQLQTLRESIEKAK